MADFFPLISRAVKALPETATLVEREAIYDRARAALTRQLRSAEPALAEETVEKELAGLEAAVLRVEAGLSIGSEPAIETQISEAVAVAANIKPIEPVAKPAEASQPAAVPTDIPETVKPIVRPRVPLASVNQRQRKTGNFGIVLAAGLPIVLGIMGVIGIFAYQNRLKPEDFKTAAKTAVTETARVTGAEPATVKDVPKVAEPALPIIPVAVRASIYEENPTNPQLRVERRGAIVWRTEPDSVDQGAAASLRLRGSMEFPDAKLNAEFLMRRNLDASFPASHTLDIRFTAMGPDAKTVKSISLPEFRTELLEKGPILQAVKAPDVDNTFLIALVNVEPFQTTNIDLLKKPGWLFFELRYSDNKRGEFVFEKGTAGERAFTEAFAAWGQ